MQQPISSSVSHTYTHATLSIVETTVRSTYGVAPAAFNPSGPRIVEGNNRPAAQSASVHDGASYTPGSSLHQALEDAVAAFYTAAVGDPGQSGGVRYSNAGFVPDPTQSSPSGTLIQAAHDSLNAFIDILA